MRKSKFNLTHLHSTTLDPGYLVPFLMIPTLPNDTFRIGLSSFIRAQPMLAPLMHEVRLFTQYWFVPNRLVWDDWEEFITGGSDLTSTPPFPTLTLDTDDAKVGSLTDYFGFPRVEGIEVSALPYRAMALIWNERYRDEDLQQPLVIDYGSGEDTTTSRELLSPSFAKDYFTMARPFTQRGGDVLVPVSDAVVTGTNQGKTIRFYVFVGSKTNNTGETLTFPLNSSNMTSTQIMNAVSSWLELHVKNGTLDSLILPEADIVFTGIGSSCASPLSNAQWDEHLVFNISPSFKVWVFPYEVTDFTSPSPVSTSLDFDTPIPNDYNVAPSNNWPSPNQPNYYAFGGGAGYFLRFYGFNKKQYNAITNATPSFAELKAISGGTATIAVTAATSGFTIRDLRTSSALQRYAERSLLYGNRYEEFIMREFGIKPRDARIQRPEYLGGGRGILNISEVLQTAESDDTGVGTMRGHGVAAISQFPIRFRCPEHGIILGLMSIRPKSVYTQGIDREWLKRSRLDFYTPELASIGMQEVLQQELYAQPDNKDKVFGYSQRYQEYRYQKPLVTGEFRDNLSFWNMARIFNNAPELTPEFINMSYSAEDFKRPFQIQDDGAHSFVAMLKNHIRAYRPIPKRAKELLR